jgi:tetratricopeptide (TPR) repeat protein
MRAAERLDAMARVCGAERAADFYEKQVLPALGSLPKSRETWMRQFEAAARLTERAPQPNRGLLATDELISQFSRTTLERKGAPADDTTVGVRTMAGESIAALADRLARRGDREEAIRAYADLERLRAMTHASRARYAQLLLQAGDCSPDALRVFVHYLAECGGSAGGPEVPEIRATVQAATRIEEGMPPREIRTRLPLNHLHLQCLGSTDTTLRNLGLAYLQLDGARGPERALPYLNRASEIDDGGESSFFLGQALFHTGRFPDAAAAFEDAVQKGYSRSRIAAWQGVAYAKAQQWDRAAETFERAEQDLTGDPGAEFFLQWGRASFLMGSADRALAHFRRALAADPAEWRAHLGLSVCLERLGRRQEARQMVEGIATQRPTNGHGPALYFLGRLLAADGLAAHALPLFRKAADSSPQDGEYSLWLGAHLDDAGDPASLPLLEKALLGRGAEPEILRRLSLGYLREGNRPMARRYLEQIHALEPDDQAVQNLYQWDLASRAVAAFNRGEYREAADMFGAICPEPPFGVLANRVALSLAFHALELQRTGAPCKEWAALADRALQLAPVDEARFLCAFADLVEGRVDRARDKFVALMASARRPEYAMFEALSACLMGDSSRLGALNSARAGNLGPLVGFLQAHVAVAQGNRDDAADKFKVWAQDADAVRKLDIPAAPVNLFGVYCLEPVGPRKATRFFQGLDASASNGYWRLSKLLTEQRSLAGEEATPGTLEKLAHCAQQYREFLGQVHGPDHALVARCYAELLYSAAVCHLRCGDTRGALQHLERAEESAAPTCAAAIRLKELVRRRLAEPSHAAALACRNQDPERAREMWQALLKQNPDDLTALHHLACLAWTRAHDALQKGNVEASVPFWEEGFENYRKLYDRQDYWDALRAKGRTLHQSATPFQEAEFENWRAQAMEMLAGTLLDLAANLLGDRSNQVSQAGRVVKILRNSKLSAVSKDRLGEELARRRLDPDPRRLSAAELDGAIRRARQLIAADPENWKARLFVVDAGSFQAELLRNQANPDHSAVARSLDAFQADSDWLFDHMGTGADARREALKKVLAEYYTSLADIKNQEAWGLMKSSKAAADGDNYPAARRGQEVARTSFQASDRAATRALLVEAVNFKATSLLADHREAYKTIEGNLDVLRKVGR